MIKHSFSRRSMLQGLGVTMALPWLESTKVWGDLDNSGSDSSEAPVRLGVIFSGNGFHSKEWWARGTGEGMQLGRVLQPLHAHREKMTFISGLYHEEARKGNIHSSQTGNVLSGAPISSGGVIRSGTSFDQLIAKSYGKSTRVPSLVLGCERSNPSVHKNYSMLYSSHISWTSPTTPTPLEIYPALAFDRLFKDKATPADQSVLDAVYEDAKNLRLKVSATDRQKLDEYLNSVREVETRIQNARARGELQGWRPTIEKVNIQRPADGVPQDIAEHMKLMCDIMVLGFQTDTTRVTTLKLNNDHSALRFPNLPSVQQPGNGIDYMIHHLLSHSDGEDWLKVNQFFMEQIAYIAKRLDSIQEGSRTLLDNTMLLSCSSMMAGARHDNDQLPILLLGRAGNQIQGGNVLDYRTGSDRQLCRLFMSMMEKMELKLDRFGDANHKLEEV
ncbi:MAG: DUF1552 domain-containing protein [Planctomycetota bacterium]|nr:DUF1552 domain-containing protein [Planctomycetota bacterium]